MPTNGYTSTATLKSYLAISDTVDDAELNQAIDAASRAIDGFCLRRFYADGTTSARTYYPINARVVHVDDISTSTGLVLQTDTGDTGTFDTTISSDDYQLEPLNGADGGLEGLPYSRIRAVESNTFPTTGRRARVQVTADWGWAAIPETVETACLILATEVFKLKDAPFGVAGFGDYGAVRVRDNPKVASLLAPYRRHGGVAVA